MLLFFWIFVVTTYFHLADSATVQLPDIQEETIEKLEFLVTNKSEIWRVNQDGDKYRYLTNTSAIGDVDYHLHKNVIFWIDTDKNEIRSQPLDMNASAHQFIFRQKGIWEPISLAIDYINDKVYVVDNAGVKIDVFELDGRYHSIVLGSDIVRPTDIELDPYESLMFVLDGCRIVRANMDGSDLVTIIKKDIRIIHGFALDLVANKIYWLRNSDFSLMSSNYSGDSISITNTNNLQKPYTKFTIFNDKIYWASDYIDFKSECCDEERGSKRKTIYQSNPIPTIKAIHSSLQVSSPNPCAQQNGGCQHLCILKFKNESSITHQCACNVGWKLTDDMRNCTLVDNFLIYIQPNIMKSHLIENCTNGFCEPYLPISQARSDFVDFDYDPKDNYLYYIVTSLLRYDTIYRVHPNESDYEVFLDGKQNNYQSLSVDSGARNMYFIDPLEKSVNVIKLCDKSKKLILLINLENPEDIVVHSNAGYIFFLQTNSSSKITFLSRVNLDGTNLIVYDVIQLRKLCGFVVDSEDGKIYLYDWNKKYIQIGNLSMEKLEKMENMWTNHIYTISVFEKWIYIVTTDSDGVRRFDKRSGEEIELILPDLTNRIVKVKVFSIKLLMKNKSNTCIDDSRGCDKLYFLAP